MEKTIKIEGSFCARFNNAMHAQFQNQMYDIVGNAKKATINLSDELNVEWRGYIDDEIEINREVQASADTALMVEKDVERDNYVSYFFQTVRNEIASPVKAQSEAAGRLLLIINRYKGLQAEAVDQETLHITGLLHDLEKAENAADCATLALTDLLKLLGEANDAYQALRTKRTNTRATTKLPTSKAVRPKTDAVYARVCRLIEASYLLSTVADDRNAIVELVNKMNQYIGEMKATYNRIQGQTSSGGGSVVPDSGSDEKPAPVEDGDGEKPTPVS